MPPVSGRTGPLLCANSPSPSLGHSVRNHPRENLSLAWTVGPNSKTVKKASPVPCFNLDRLLAGHLLTVGSPLLL
ncbi:hypothetical protein M747DRAFT_297664, partial [Aspergillus niger ATCC 13496]